MTKRINHHESNSIVSSAYCNRTKRKQHRTNFFTKSLHHSRLTSFPMSLFKDGMMRKQNKVFLHNVLLSQAKLTLTQVRYMLLMEVHFCTKFDGLRISLSETSAIYMLSMLKPNMVSVKLYLMDRVINHLQKIAKTVEEV